MALSSTLSTPEKPKQATDLQKLLQKREESVAAAITKAKIVGKAEAQVAEAVSKAKAQGTEKKAPGAIAADKPSTLKPSGVSQSSLTSSLASKVVSNDKGSTPSLSERVAGLAQRSTSPSKTSAVQERTGQAPSAVGGSAASKTSTPSVGQKTGQASSLMERLALSAPKGADTTKTAAPTIAEKINGQAAGRSSSTTLTEKSSAVQDKLGQGGSLKFVPGARSNITLTKDSTPSFSQSASVVPQKSNGLLAGRSGTTTVQKTEAAPQTTGQTTNPRAEQSRRTAEFGQTSAPSVFEKLALASASKISTPSVPQSSSVTPARSDTQTAGRSSSTTPTQTVSAGRSEMQDRIKQIMMDKSPPAGANAPGAQKAVPSGAPDDKAPTSKLLQKPTSVSDKGKDQPDARSSSLQRRVLETSITSSSKAAGDDKGSKTSPQASSLAQRLASSTANVSSSSTPSLLQNSSSVSKKGDVQSTLAKAAEDKATAFKPSSLTATLAKSSSQVSESTAAKRAGSLTERLATSATSDTILSKSATPSLPRSSSLQPLASSTSKLLTQSSKQGGSMVTPTPQAQPTDAANPIKQRLAAMVGAVDQVNKTTVTNDKSTTQSVLPSKDANAGNSATKSSRSTSAGATPSTSVAASKVSDGKSLTLTERLAKSASPSATTQAAKSTTSSLPPSSSTTQAVKSTTSSLPPTSTLASGKKDSPAAVTTSAKTPGVQSDLQKSIREKIMQSTKPSTTSASKDAVQSSQTSTSATAQKSGGASTPVKERLLQQLAAAKQVKESVGPSERLTKEIVR